MILSHARRFILIRGYKVASTSVEMALSTLCGDDDVITPLVVREEQIREKLGFPGPKNYALNKVHETYYARSIASVTGTRRGMACPYPLKYHEHMSLSEVLDRSGTGSDYQVIGITRDPYEKAVSWVKWLVNHTYYESGLPEKEIDLATLRELIGHRIKSGSMLRCHNFKLYHDDRNTNCHFLRYENLQEDFDRLMALFGKPSLTLPVMKQSQSLKGMPALEILTAAQRRAINDLFHEEFLHFGYTKQ